MLSRMICTLDPNKIGAGLRLDQGNLVVSCSGSDVIYPANNHRSVFGTIPIGAGMASYEMYFYSNLQNSLAGLAAAGIAEAVCSLTKAVGSEPFSYALWPADGTVYNDDIPIAGSGGPNIPKTAERHCLSILLMQGPSPLMVIMVDGNVIFQTSVAAGKFYLPAVSLGSSVVGDVSACFNFGQNLFDYPNFPVDMGSAGTVIIKAPGWSERTSDGNGAVYLALLEEGVTTAPTDTPANQQYRPRIKNWDTFSIRRAPSIWMWNQGSASQIQQAAYGVLEIANYDQKYTFLLDVDWQGSTLYLKAPEATLLSTGTSIRDTPTFATANVDNIEMTDEDTISITLKDTLARLDKQLTCKFNKPFADPGAANIMIPLTFGGVRNRVLLLVDSPNRLWQMHDSNVPNVTLVADMAAPLDPHASPPQYTPALNGSGIQSETMPVGKFTVDCSSYGSQTVIPGIDDLFNGAGEFPHNSAGVWTGTNGAPTGFTWSNGAGSSIGETDLAIFGTARGATIRSATIFNPSASKYGEQLAQDSGVLQPLLPGRTYRVTFKLYNVQTEPPFFIGGMQGGIVLATGLTTNAADYITGISNPLTTSVLAEQSFTFEFTIPPGANRKLYFIATPSAGNAPGNAQGTVSATILDVKLELLGQYVEVPFVGYPLEQYYNEILCVHEGEDPSIFSLTDAQQIGRRKDGTVIPWGISYDAPPNVLAALRDPLDSLGNPAAVIYTDNLGTIRVRRYVNPKDPAGRPPFKFDITPANAERPIAIRVDKAAGLTTSGGCRRNPSPFSDSDFVTDQTIVPQDVKTRFKRVSQFQRTSSVNPAAQYVFAQTANIFDTLLDEVSDLQDYCLDPAVKVYSPQIFTDGTTDNGVRQFVDVTMTFDSLMQLGVTIKCNVYDVGFGDIASMTYPTPEGDDWFVNEPVEVIAWELFPAAGKIILTLAI